MHWKKPKNTEKYYWTQHSLMKMKFYNLSQQRITRVIKSPQRIEEGIADKTVAVMQPPSITTKNGKKAWTSEIWAMYEIKKSNNDQKIMPKNLLNQQKQFKIISAWRYPGVSPRRNPIPQKILDEINNLK